MSFESAKMQYSPVQKNRLFAAGIKYSDIDWTSFDDIINAFEQRIDQWYLRPVRVLKDHSDGHGGFAALAICCLTIDCMCQFEGGKVVSNRSLFTNFVHRRLPHYGRLLAIPITFPKIDSHNLCYDLNVHGAIKTRQLGSIADVLYYVFRCGILHSAHAPLIGVICGLKTRRYSVRKKSLAKYQAIGTAGADCPVVVIDPWKLFSDIEASFQDYLARLREASAASPIRRRFNVKFEDSFGVSIAGAL